MKVVLPVAGFGKRMRPHTWSKPKPLLNIAGKPLLGHVLDRLLPLDIDEIVFITGWLGKDIEAYVEANYEFKTHYVEQEELKGQAHAVYLAKDYLQGPSLIIFVDTIWEADLTSLMSGDIDGIIYVKEVEDPRRFGIVLEEDGLVTRYVEKPETCEHHKATVGMYYVRDSAALVSAIEYVLDNDIRVKGEYYIANALNVMIERGARFVSSPISVWEDCGKPETVLHSNRYLLDSGCATNGEYPGSVIVPPVHIAEGATVENAVVGPYVTLCSGVTVRNSVIRDSIVEADATLENVVLDRSLIGERALLRGSVQQANVGDDVVVDAQERHY